MTYFRTGRCLYEISFLCPIFVGCLFAFFRVLSRFSNKSNFRRENQLKIRKFIFCSENTRSKKSLLFWAKTNQQALSGSRCTGQIRQKPVQRTGLNKVSRNVCFVGSVVPTLSPAYWRWGLRPGQVEQFNQPVFITVLLCQSFNFRVIHFSYLSELYILQCYALHWTIYHTSVLSKSSPHENFVRYLQDLYILKQLGK